MYKQLTLIFLIILSFLLVGCSNQEFTPNEQERIITNSLSNPWGMSYIDEEQTQIFITQKGGELVLYNLDKERLIQIEGVPEVHTSGQGGLLDVDYDEGFIYLTYSASENGRSATHVGRGLFNFEESTVENFEVLRIIKPFVNSNSHFGSRVLVVDEFIYITTGDRASKDFSENHPSQNTSNELGSIVRLYKNGSIPESNPFVGVDGFVDSIYTYGHRNIQGIVEFEGDIYVSGHGEQDGDMIHKLVAGGNYGWPITHYGCTYARGQKIGEFAHEREDIVNPFHYWECGSGGFPPAGMGVFNDKLYVGNLRGQYLGEFEFNENRSGLIQRGKYVKGERIRDVLHFEDGVYVVTDSGKLIQVNLR